MGFRRASIAIVIFLCLLVIGVTQTDANTGVHSEGYWAEQYNSLQIQIAEIEADQVKTNAQRVALHDAAAKLKVKIDRYVLFAYKDTTNNFSPLTTQVIEDKAARQYFSAAVDHQEEVVDNYLQIEKTLAIVEQQTAASVEMLKVKRGEAERVKSWLEANRERLTDTDSRQQLLPTTVPPNASAAIAIEYAKAQLGKPYVFATAGPTTFDCSGLTLQAWAAAGYSLDHYSGTQYRQTTRISEAELLPGDLVFYGPGGANHVSMYVGEGMVIAAPYSGTVVRVQKMTRGAVGYGRVW